jgi:O-methyltransferase
MGYGLPLANRIRLTVHQCAARFGYGLVNLAMDSKGPRLKRLCEIQKGRKMLLTGAEAWILATLAESVKKIPGDIAEVGTFQGASAGLIASSSEKTLYVFDTFEGLPEPEDSEKDQGSWAKKGSFSASFEGVKSYLHQWPSIKINKGVFPASASALGDLRFAFVHLDVDLYRGTLDSLGWFYQRMSPGGIILSHDYNVCAGVKQAFEEFFADRQEVVIELPTNQCMVVKT